MKFRFQYLVNPECLPVESPRTIHVTTEEAEMNFTLTGRVTGRKLFDEVVRVVGLRESRFFGLRFIDHRGNGAWLSLNEKISSQWVNPEDPLWRFHFCVQYFPEDVTAELRDDVVALRLLLAQVKRAILSGDICCPRSTAFCLASFDLQMRYGDWSEEVSAKWVEEKLLPGDDPKSVCDPQQNRMRESRIVEEWKKRKGWSKTDSMRRYLELAQDLDTYGIEYFPADYATEYERVSEILVGIHTSGVNLCSSNDKEDVRTRIEWADVKKISRHKWKFVVKLWEKDLPELIFRAESPEIHERMYDLCRGYREHDLRRNRRRNTIRIMEVKMSPRVKEEDRESVKEKGRDKKLESLLMKDGQADEEISMRNLERRLEEAMELRRQIAAEADRERALADELRRKNRQLEEIRSLMLDERRKAMESEAEMRVFQEEAQKEREKWRQAMQVTERQVKEEGRKLEAREEEVETLRQQLEVIGVLEQM